MMLDVSQLTRCYGTLVAVDRVSFTIEKGEIVGLLGHNGAGKTTIMKILSGYLEPDRGDVTFNGLDLGQHTKALQRDLGYLPETLPVYPDMTVVDYLDYTAQLKGLTGEQKRQEIRRAVAATETGGELLSPIATLSRGFRQRVGVAQAILGRPGLLILDEPTNGLDPTQTEHMRRLIRELAQDATVLLSTHIMQEVDALCDRVLILRGGALAVDARLDQLRSSNAVRILTSLGPSAAQPLLSGIGGVVRVSPLSGEIGAAHGYRLALDAGGEQHAVCAAVTRSLLAAGAELYELRREQRDLETLFREVSTAPTIKHLTTDDGIQEQTDVAA
jgi:ABC-2 type transport system ATP-binding protein